MTESNCYPFTQLFISAYKAARLIEKKPIMKQAILILTEWNKCIESVNKMKLKILLGTQVTQYLIHTYETLLN